MATFTITRIKSLTPPSRGETREWIRCRKHGRYYHRDYVPYSLSNPVMWLSCGCTPYRSRGENEVCTVPEAEALTGIYCKAVGLA